MNDDPRHLKQLNEIDHGRRVALAYDVFREVFAAKRETVCKQIVTAYASGKSPQEIYNAVASLHALEDLENTVRQAINKGQRSGKELLNGAPGKLS